MSDYLASSVDVIVATSIGSAVGIVFFFWGVTDAVSEDVRAELFQEDRKAQSNVVLAFMIFYCMSIVLIAYHAGRLDYYLLFPLIFFVLLYAVDRMSIWKYVENRTPIRAALMSLVYFSLHLVLVAGDKVRELSDGKYESSYEIEFAEKYKDTERGEFFAANSNYVFLWDNNKRRMHIIPRSGVSSYQIKVVH
ncbi:MAG: hypothetical protein KUG82_06545 [Pseudomonadales bacterium]|nr:hypothetical protein [Pseudomonadales bacterium]